MSLAGKRLLKLPVVELKGRLAAADICSAKEEPFSLKEGWVMAGAGVFCSQRFLPSVCMHAYECVIESASEELTSIYLF